MLLAIEASMQHCLSCVAPSYLQIMKFTVQAIIFIIRISLPSNTPKEHTCSCVKHIYEVCIRFYQYELKLPAYDLHTYWLPEQDNLRPNYQRGPRENEKGDISWNALSFTIWNEIKEQLNISCVSTSFQVEFAPPTWCDGDLATCGLGIQIHTCLTLRRNGQIGGLIKNRVKQSVALEGIVLLYTYYEHLCTLLIDVANLAHSTISF